MVERRADPADRRSYALHLTNKGRDTMKAIGRVARDHQDALLASLTAEERDLLASLLLRVADQEGLRPGVHPGFSRLGAGGEPISSRGNVYLTFASRRAHASSFAVRARSDAEGVHAWARSLSARRTPRPSISITKTMERARPSF
jgi:hypothetical protein